MVTRIPGPYAELTRGFDAAPMKEQGMTLRQKQNIKMGNLPGMLLRLSQQAFGTNYEKWIAVFGNAEQTFMVTATYPETGAKQFSAPLKAVVLSARSVGSKPDAIAESLPFTLTPSAKLKPASGIGKMLLYTRDGTVQQRSPQDPLFIAAPSLGKVPVADRREYAQNRLSQTAQTKVGKTLSHEPTEINGLEGFETVAEAQDARSETPLALYQVMLFDEEGYILMQGMVGASMREEYLPEFKAMARSLKQKPVKNKR